MALVVGAAILVVASATALLRKWLWRMVQARLLGQREPLPDPLRVVLLLQFPELIHEIDELWGRPRAAMRRLLRQGAELIREGKHSFALEALRKAFLAAVTRKEKLGMYLLLARTSYEIRELRHAEDYYRQAVELARTPRDASSRGRALMGLAMVLRDIGREDESLRSLDEAFAMARKRKLLPAQAAICGVAGLLYRQRGRREASITCFAYALATNRLINHRAGEAEALCNMGIVLRESGDWRGAVPYFEDALRVEGEIGNARHKARTLVQVALAYHAGGDLTSALNYVKDAVHLQKEAGDLKELADTYATLGAIYREHGKVTESIDQLENALALEREIRYRDGEAKTLANLAATYLTRGSRPDLEQALPLLKDSAAAHEDLGNLRELVATLATLGVVLRRLGQAGEAVRTLDKAEKLARSISHRAKLAETLANHGLALRDAGKIERAVGKLREAAEIQRDLKSHHLPQTLDALGSCLWHLASDYFSVGSDTLAVECLRELLVLDEELGDKQGQAKVSVRLGDALLAYSLPEAIESYRRALALNREIGHPVGELIARQRLDAAQRLLLGQP